MTLLFRFLSHKNPQDATEESQRFGESNVVPRIGETVVLPNEGGRFVVTNVVHEFTAGRRQELEFLNIYLARIAEPEKTVSQ